MLSELRHDRKLSSSRSCRSSESMKRYRERCDWDWPVELGDCPWGRPPVASLHERQAGESPGEAGRRLERFSEASHLKLAVQVHSLDELWEGHQWWSRLPERRSFLPRSEDGRWSWYRLRQKGHMKINFLRTSDGSSPDQPSFVAWARAPSRPERFAAILGDPVAHSRTPTEHHAYFASRGMPVLALRLREDELDVDALTQLASLGMSHAAVTSPLKKRAAAVSGATGGLGAVNTLARDGDAWHVANTDAAALSDWLHPIAGRRVVLWGGGGTRDAVMAAVPDAAAYSARRAVPVDEDGSEIPDPEVVIWAVGRTRQEDCQWPPARWRPECVYDLNYAEDSPGREYALSRGCRYESGLRMFELQAEAQRAFWSRLAQHSDDDDDREVGRDVRQ